MARGSIVRRGDSWRLTVELPPDGSGKRRRLTETVTGTKKAAQRRLAELVLQADQHRLGATTRLTVAEYLDVWLRDHAATRAPKTFEVYTGLSRYIIDRLGTVPLARLSPSHLVAFFTTLRQTPRQDGAGTLAPTTVHAVYRLLRTALNTAVRWRLLSRSPLDGVEAPRVPRREMQTLDAAQARDLLAATAAEGVKWQAFFTVLLNAGCRPGELKALRWADVDLADGEMRLQRHVQRITGQGMVAGPTKTTTGRRPVALGADVVALLRKHRAEQAETRLRAGSLWQQLDLVFPNAFGGYLEGGTVERVFNRACRRADVPRIRLYDLRHTSASLLLASGVHPKIVSERLGHASVNLTLSTYSHVLPGLQQDAADTLEAALKEAK